MHKEMHKITDITVKNGEYLTGNAQVEKMISRQGISEQKLPGSATSRMKSTELSQAYFTRK
jgi:hypothetical protein